MTAVRPLARADLAQVVEVYERTMRSGEVPPPAGLAPYFERTLLDHPWADAETPSLVFEADDGRVLGFIGAHARRGLLDGRSIRLVCAGHLVSAPEHRNLAIGPRLLRALLSGPQALTITDAATGLVNDMWVRLGGHTLQPQSFVWARLFRPSQAVLDWWLELRGRHRLRRFTQRAWPLLDARVARVTRPPAPDPRIEVVPLTTRDLIDHQSVIAPGARLTVDYDDRYAEWLFGELEALTRRGKLVRRMCLRDDRVLGWYIAYLRPTGMSQVIEVAARKGAMELVLDRMFWDAWEDGVPGLEGRVEPALFEPLSRRRCIFRPSARALFHSRDAGIAAAMALGESSLTRLDGESWMGHHTEAFAI